jgi:hypothetical protein
LKSKRAPGGGGGQRTGGKKRDRHTWQCHHARSFAKNTEQHRVIPSNTEQKNETHRKLADLGNLCRVKEACDLARNIARTFMRSKGGAKVGAPTANPLLLALWNANKWPK